MVKKTLPAFTGAPLIEIPKNIPIANYARDDFGQAILAEYNERVARGYNRNLALRVLSYKNGVVQGSNPFAVVLMNTIVADAGIHVATPTDIETILARNAVSLAGQYVDMGLVLRSRADPNTYIANNLADQVEKRGKKVGKTPHVLPLNGLELVNDSSSPHGLAFNVMEAAQIVEAPQLIGRNNGKRFSETDETGLPSKFASDGTRTLYTRDGGLSRLYLDRDALVDSSGGGGNLANSYDSGRVVLVRAEGAL